MIPIKFEKALEFSPGAVSDLVGRLRRGTSKHRDLSPESLYWGYSVRRLGSGPVSLSSRANRLGFRAWAVEIGHDVSTQEKLRDFAAYTKLVACKQRWRAESDMIPCPGEAVDYYDRLLRTYLEQQSRGGGWFRLRRWDWSRMLILLGEERLTRLCNEKGISPEALLWADEGLDSTA